MGALLCEQVLLLNTLELMVHPASWGANVQRIFFSGAALDAARNLG